MKVMHILLVEDNPGYISLIREAFHDAGISSQITAMTDGEPALRHLRSHNDSQSLPDIILLDLNLPKMDGKQVLATIKADPVLRSIPVVVLSSSRDRRDVLASYDNHANCYIAKPLSYNELVDVAKGIGFFWTQIAMLPAKVH